MIIIETNRLYFRLLNEGDATEEYVGWLNDSEVNQYLETRHQEQDVESCRRFIDLCNEDDASCLLGIFTKDTGLHIGNVKLGFIHHLYKRAQLSLFIGEKACWGKGYGKEIIGAVTNYGFDVLGLNRIEAGCYEDNLASLRAFIKVGYSVEGFFRQHVDFQGRLVGCFWLGMLRGERD